MKFGLFTVALPDQTLGEVAEWAGANGFPALEVPCWPTTTGAVRRYAGVTHIDVDDLSPTRASEIRDEVASHGCEIVALGFYPNNLHPDPEHRAAVNEHTKKVMGAAETLGVPTVNTFLGADQHKTPAENIRDAKPVLDDLVAAARDHGVKLTIENCPMIFSYDEWPGGHNIFHNPKAWREIFGWYDDDTLGLNLDPSHLVWLMIDIERVVREFGSKVHFVQAKDVLIDTEGLYENGTISSGIGWQVPRLPGLGDVDWSRFIGALHRAGYTGPVVIEHEDRQFEGDPDLVKDGFLIARNVVAPWIPQEF